MSLMLFCALNPSNPYGYYTILRIACCGISIYLGAAALDLKRKSWAWIFAVIAIIYNPIFRIHLNREFWSYVNIATIIIAIISIFVFKAEKASAEGNNEQNIET